MTDAELTFGALDFLADPFHALADGFTTGNPEPLLTALPRLLLDGEIITHERDSNRSLTFRLEVTGDDTLALNEAEAALVREVNRPRNTLRWKPPGMNTPVTVFDTFAGVVTQVFNDLDELRNKRVYSVTIPALPHARSETLRTATLVTPPSTVTLLDACDSLTGWGPVGGTWPAPTLDTTTKYAGTGSLKVTGSYRVYGLYSGGGDGLGWQRTGSFAAAAGTHVVAALRGNYPMNGQPTMAYTSTGAPAQQATVVSSVALGDGWVEYTWALNNDAPMTVTDFYIFTSVAVPWTPGTYTITAWLDNIRTYAAGAPVAKQGLRSLETGGSVRTPGTLRLSNSTTALGSVLVHTCADLGDGYRPDVTRWYPSSGAGGTRTTNAASISGNSFTTGATFELPNSMLEPGPYAVLIKGNATAAPDAATVTAQSMFGSASTTATLFGPTVSVSGNAGAGISALGVMHLPATSTPDQSAGKTRLTVAVSGPTGTKFDELWLFRLDGQLTWLDDTSTQRTWIESPTPELPYGAVWVGNNADNSDARHPGSALRMLGRHIFEAPVAQVFVAATGAAPAMDLLHYRTWHSNAAD